MMRALRRILNPWVLSSPLQTHLISTRISRAQVIDSCDSKLLGWGFCKFSASKSFSSIPKSIFGNLDAADAVDGGTRKNHDDSDGNGDKGEENDFEGEENDFEAVDSGEKDAELIQNVEKIMGFLRDFGRNGIEAKRALDGCSIPVSPELVMNVLSRARNDWEAAFTFFLWAGKQPGYSHSVREYHSMISVLGKMRKFDTAWSLIDAMKREQMATPQTLMIMVRKYCSAHDVAKAVGTFYAFKRYGFKVGIKEFQDLLSALCRYKNVQDAEHLLFCNEGVFPIDSKSLNIVLNGWCNVMVNLQQAKRFWWNMGDRGIARDIYSYGSMISCYSKAGSLRDVMKLYDQMRELGIEPDRKVYNAVIYALAKCNCVKEALNLLKEMEKHGCVPSTVTYTSLIKPLCKARRVDEARALLDEMLMKGISPSDRTYHAFFAIARSAEEVFELLDRMKVQGCGPTSDTYIMLIRKFSRWRQFDNVFKLWDEMIANGPGPDRSSYIVLIHGLFLNGKLDDAYMYYLEMKEKGFAPEPKTDQMIEAWISGKETAQSQLLEFDDKKQGQVPSRTKKFSTALSLERLSKTT